MKDHEVTCDGKVRSLEVGNGMKDRRREQIIRPNLTANRRNMNGFPCHLLIPTGVFPTE